MFSPRFVIVVVVIIVVAGLYQRVVEKRKTAAREAVAAAHGLRFEPGKVRPDQGWPLPFFDRGHGQRVHDRMWRPDNSGVVFSYEYRTGSKTGDHDNETSHRHTCALVVLPFTAPETRIGRESAFSRVARAVGFGDIEVESPAFNRAYRLLSRDERFAITLFDQPLIGWFVSNETTLGEHTVELSGRWLLVAGTQRRPEEYPSLLEFAEQLRSRLPTVLQSLYPAAS